MSEHEELEHSVAAWVLGALDGEEAEAMRIHVEACPSCREEASRLRRAVGALPLSVEEVAPPARLRERILSAAAASRGASAAPVRMRAIAPAPSVRRKGVVDLWGRMPVYAAAAGVVIALVIGLVAGDLIGRGTPPVASSQVARFSLLGHQALAGARANVIDLKADGVALVDFSGLPMLEAGRVYEVWLITPGGRADPAAVFVPDSNGSKVVLVNKALTGYSEMAITSEAGPDGAKAPTQQPQLYGNLA